MLSYLLGWLDSFLASCLVSWLVSCSVACSLSWSVSCSVICLAGPRQQMSWLTRGGHHWEPAGGSFVCLRCFSWTSDSGSAKGHTKCAGHSMLDQVSSPGLGHRLLVAITETSPCVVCSSCGATMEAFPRLLLQACKKVPARGGQVALSRLAAGKHPYQRSEAKLLAVFSVARMATSGLTFLPCRTHKVRSGGE